jgi:molecular chaperone DnaK
MVKDAETHAEDDRKLMETVQARNGLDALVHSVKKSLAEYGDKIDGGERSKIESAINDAESGLKDKDATTEALNAKSEALAKASQKLGELMYAKAQAEAGGGQAGGDPGGGQGGGTSGGAKPSDEKVVDAEFTEVKDR